MIDEIIKLAFKEDIGEGDYSSLSCVPEEAQGKAHLLVKDTGVIAGVELAEQIFRYYDASLQLKCLIQDGEKVHPGDIVFEVEGKSQSILATERLVLNFMQRMSAIATKTNRIVEIIKGTPAQLLDTRKTTPGLREIEKWAVRIGGGYNHRMGLYDMIMLKDNHIDYAGGIKNAIDKANAYILKNNLDIPIEIEARDEVELNKIIAVGGVNRIMLDNFTPEKIKEVLPNIPKTIETEASGNITEETIRSYAETGVDFISSGALTHTIASLDLSLKAKY